MLLDVSWTSFVSLKGPTVLIARTYFSRNLLWQAQAITSLNSVPSIVTPWQVASLQDRDDRDRDERDRVEKPPAPQAFRGNVRGWLLPSVSHKQTHPVESMALHVERDYTIGLAFPMPKPAIVGADL